MKSNLPTNDFRELWDTLLLNFNIVICTEKLKGCSIIDLNILKLIYANSDIKIKEIVKTLKVPNSTLTNAINRLSKRGLLQRKLSDYDLRSFDLELTPTGTSAVEEHIIEENKAFADLLQDLNEEEIVEFKRLFKKIVDGKVYKHSNTK